MRALRPDNPRAIDDYPRGRGAILKETLTEYTAENLDPLSDVLLPE
jgi:hypothetical protein